MEIFKVIKNEGPADALFWKHRGEDFLAGSQLIVSEKEEALFCRGGVVYEVFQAGRYTLSTQNYPFITSFLKMFTGGVSAFNCKVYYVNKTDNLELNWGTASPIQVTDPVWKLQVNVRGYGSYTVRVKDSKKFYLKFVTLNADWLGRDVLEDNFRTVFQQKISTCIAKALRESNEELIAVSERVDSLAQTIKPILAPVLDEYGLALVNFYLGALEIPSDDPARQQIQKARAKKAEMNLLGDDWQRAQNVEILKDAVNNPGMGAVNALGIGLGMAPALGGVIGNNAQQMMSGQNSPSAPTPPPRPAADAIVCECGTSNPPNARFCCGCGKPLAPPTGRFCTKCGTPLEPSAKFCHECGTKQES